MSANPFLPEIQVTFSPLWWHYHYGMDFTKEAWENPVHRTEREREQRRLLFDRFGDCGLGEKNPKPRPVIGVEYGDRFMSALWGCEIKYLEDQEPAAIALPEAAERMRNLVLPDVNQSPIVRKSMEDGKILAEKYGSCEMNVNFGGPMNNAVSVFGEEILVNCLTDSELTQRVLYLMGEAVLSVHDDVVCKFNQTRSEEKRSVFFGLGNCPVCMISPKVYQAVVQPVDLWLRNQFSGEFLLHHDGFFHPYNEVYQSLHPTWLDIGWGTDIKKVRQAFPGVKLSALIEVSDLSEMSIDEIDQTIIRMAEDEGMTGLFSHITIYDVGPDIPDSTIQHLVTFPGRVRL